MQWTFRVALVLFIATFLQAQQTTISDTIYAPNGQLATGTATIQSATQNQQGFTDINGHFQGTNVISTTFTNGVFSVSLFPNQGSIPTSTYKVIFSAVTAGGAQSYTWTQTWYIPVSGSPIPINCHGTPGCIGANVTGPYSPPPAVIVGPTGAMGATGATGQNGSTGAIGPTGSTGLHWRGLWTSGINYAVNDAVNTGGSSYIAILSGAGNPPATSPSYWSVLAAIGDTGQYGGGISLEYNFNTSTTNSDPGIGNFALNNATQNSATAGYVSFSDTNGFSQGVTLASMCAGGNGGQLRFAELYQPSRFILFTVTACIAHSTYEELTISQINSGLGSPSPFAGGDTILLAFTQTGATGPTGLTGSTGATGATGSLPTYNGHVLFGGSAPSAPSATCGNGTISVIGTDNSFTVTAGTGATTCVINFATSFTTIPGCSATGTASGGNPQIGTVSASSVTINGGLSQHIFGANCF